MLFKQHKVIIGFNSEFYDIPILKREGLLNGNNLSLDLRVIIKKRAGLLKCSYESFSLSNLAKFFDISNKDEHFDYDILKNTGFTIEELKKIEKYTKQDVKVTKEMFEYVYKFFLPLKEYMRKYDQITFKWLTSSIASYTYKVICYLAKIPEEYNDKITHKTYQGGYVKEPNKEYYEGDIYYMDFSSLYPNIMAQGNLFSYRCNCCTDKEKWNTSELFNLQGAYCSKKQGKIENVILDLYKKRIEYKKNKNKREYVIKIIINSLYGITGNETFKSLYKYETATDCTYIGRKIIQYSIKHFENNGYEVIYGDTDSCFIYDNKKNKTLMIKTKDDLIKNIKFNFPFPSDTFDMKIDEEIKKIWFFKNNNKINKKQYIYLNKDNKIKIVGHPMIKRDGSKIGLKIFNKHIKDILKDINTKFNYEQIKKWAYEELNKDILVAAREIKCFDVSDYKNSTQFQAQVSKKYGKGKHKLIPNKKYGVGKGNIKYCTKKEFQKQGLNVNAIDLSKMWKELKTFIKNTPEPVIKNKKKREINISLFEWTNTEV